MFSFREFPSAMTLFITRESLQFHTKVLAGICMLETRIRPVSEVILSVAATGWRVVVFKIVVVLALFVDSGG